MKKSAETGGGGGSNSGAGSGAATPHPNNNGAPKGKDSEQTNKHVEMILAQYLKSKGYASAEQALREDASLDQEKEISLEELAKIFPNEEIGSDINIPSWVLMYNQAEQGNPDAYAQSYGELRRWIDTSLDMYKNELFAVSYPLFIHSYLDLMERDLCEKGKEFMDKYKGDHMVLHAHDIEQLSLIKSRQHAMEDSLAKLFRTNKYCLRISGVTLELLLTFLKEHSFMMLLRIVNQYLNINTHEESTKGIQIQDADIGITGHTQHQIERFNSQSVTLGPLSMDPALVEETEQTLRNQVQQQKSKDTEQKGRNEASSLLSDFSKGQFNFGLDPIPSDSIPLPPPKGDDILAQIQKLKDIGKRVSLSPAALPSICMYTMHNTDDTLNCTALSDDLSLMAGGFSESYIKIWSLKKKPLLGMTSDFDPLSIYNDKDLEGVREKHNDNYRRLVGHSGPVYGLDLSFDNKYLISCSEDKTARLWSMDTYTNVVCYKGHNFPIWDVAFGPFGFYFATASHDRTSRLWSCDHIYPLRIFAGHLSDVNCVRFHPNSKYIVTGSCDKTTRLWDVQRGTCVRVFTGHKGSVQSVAISPDGRIMASAGKNKKHQTCDRDENIVCVWDLGSGKCMSEFSGHTDNIYSLSFSQEGSLLLSGSADKTVRAWDVKRSEETSVHPIISQRQLLGGSNKSENDSDKDADKDKMDIEPSSENQNGSGGEKNNETSSKVKNGKSTETPLKRDAEGRWKALKVVESEQLLKTWRTKSTPVYQVKFSKRNLAMAIGAYSLS
ncbi:Transcription initiation factor TFIID subunit 5 [Mycoemilia scoparia]|uniref:Transcription initiation factor TFIID subunit 5 n=1 Tax=Mycoemilia scoparia TaxID=417184 RepID=A0A9W8DX48_9FUNG|nr:Transcription initiation factor TFIID subunit 5 [Mycoemilia scoparia]